jgi:predicted aldo/keto reductase-like oxidoreductase
MRYRPFGRLGYEVSALGFGCMRLPTLGDHARIDEPEAISMLHNALEHGVNYVDTAYVCHGGNSEQVVGKALQGGYRDKAKIATKLPLRQVSAYADLDRILNEQLKRLQIDHIDVYLLHGMHQTQWERMRGLGVIRWAEGALADGRIGCLGFSFHHTFEAFQKILGDYDGWACCQIQYNFLGEETQAGTRGLQYAASWDLAVIVMEPLLGGKLASPPDSIRAIWEQAPRERSPAEGALQWVWTHPQVSVTLSGMTAMEQVRENVAAASRSAANTLTEEELRLFALAREAYEKLAPVPCTQCSYCMPCPNGVQIPYNFRTFGDGVIHDSYVQPRFRYAQLDPVERASICVACRECEEKCRQGIPISEWMPLVRSVLGEGADYDPACRPQS